MGAVLVGMDFEGQGDAVLLGHGQEAFHGVRRQRYLYPGDREPEPGGYLDLLPHVFDQLVVVHQPVTADPRVHVDCERGGYKVHFCDKIAELAHEVVIDPVREAAQAGEANDFKPRAETFGRHFADQAVEVVLPGVGRPGEAVKGEALDWRAEAGHRCATFMVLVSCSSMCRTPWSVMM